MQMNLNELMAFSLDNRVNKLFTGDKYLPAQSMYISNSSNYLRQDSNEIHYQPMHVHTNKQRTGTQALTLIPVEYVNCWPIVNPT